MPSQQATGTITPASLSVEENIATVTAVGTFVLKVNTTNLANGETVLLGLKTKVLTGGTAVYEYGPRAFAHIQSQPVKTSPPVLSLYSLVATIQQIGGTLRAYEWEIIKL